VTLDLPPNNESKSRAWCFKFVLPDSPNHVVMNCDEGFSLGAPASNQAFKARPPQLLYASKVSPFLAKQSMNPEAKIVTPSHPISPVAWYNFYQTNGQ